MPYYTTLYGIKLLYAKLFDRDALQSALVDACLAGRPQEAERLLNAGADPNITVDLPVPFSTDPPLATSPLHAAVSGGLSAESRVDTVRVLLRRGADARACNSLVLHVVASERQHDASGVVLVRLLLEAGATVRAADKKALQQICGADVTLMAAFEGTGMDMEPPDGHAAVQQVASATASRSFARLLLDAARRCWPATPATHM